MEQYKIGFANDYYTLWSLYGDQYHFVKNISKDIDVVKQKYPNLEIDLDLKGSYYEPLNYQKQESKELNPDIFQFGKYSDTNISDCTDFPYIIWYYDCIKRNYVQDENNSNDKYLAHLFVIDLQLRKNNYYYVNDKWLTHDEFTKYNAQQVNAARCIELYKLGEPFVFEVKSNPDIDGYLQLPTTGFLKFQEVKEFQYNGWSYYLPVVNGKSRRIKGKCLTIEKYTYNEETNVVNVEQFKVNR